MARPSVWSAGFALVPVSVASMVGLRVFFGRNDGYLHRRLPRQGRRVTRQPPPPPPHPPRARAPTRAMPHSTPRPGARRPAPALMTCNLHASTACGPPGPYAALGPVAAGPPGCSIGAVAAVRTWESAESVAAVAAVAAVGSGPVAGRRVSGRRRRAGRGGPDPVCPLARVSRHRSRRSRHFLRGRPPWSRSHRSRRSHRWSRSRTCRPRRPSPPKNPDPGLPLWPP